MQADDSALIEQTLAGDKRAFDELVARHGDRVFRIAHRFFRDRQEVEDIAQDAFLQAYRSLGTCRNRQSFSGWLSVITVRICYRKLREQRKRPENSASSLQQAEENVMERFCSSPWSSPADDQEQQALCRDLADKVLQRMTSKEHMILVLTEVEGLSIREAARHLGISAVNAKVSAFRARKRAMSIINNLMSTRQSTSGGR